MKRGWPERWQEPGAWALILRPLSWAYGLLWRLDQAWKSLRDPQRVAGLWVISVGNLSVGGTGKSPLVRAVAQMALKKRKRTAVLLRGYGAQTGPRPLWVARGAGALVPASLSGDEAQEHARVRGLGVLVDADRLRGAKAARAQGYEVLILDDGFQRRWQLRRDVELLLASEKEIARGERLLPWGPWREPWAVAAKADALLLQDAPTTLALGAPWSGLPTLRVGYQAKRLMNWSKGRFSAGPALGRLKSLPVLALSGLGQPERFEASLKALGALPRAARFGDHHAFSAEDLSSLELGPAKAIVTTMKDAMRLPAAWEPALPVLVLEAELVSQPASDLKKLLEKTLR